MYKVLQFLVALIAVLHIGFCILEMFLWTKPLGLKIFRQSIEKAQISAALAANQGLYNLFLAAGLFWSLVHPSGDFAWQLQLFFVGCVLVAAIFGAYTVSRRILLIQGGPAILALVLLILQTDRMTSLLSPGL